MRVYRYKSDDLENWNSFLEFSKNSTFLLNRNFMDYHSDKFEDYSLLVEEDDEIVAMLPSCITNKNIITSHGGLTYGGLIVKNDATLNDTLSYFCAMLRYLCQCDIKTLIYKEMPSIYNSIPSDEQQYALFLLEGRLIRRDTSIAVAQKHKLEYQNRRKRQIKNAQKKGVDVKEVNDFQEFWNKILSPSLMLRYGVIPVHSLAEIELLANRFPDNIRQFNVYHEGKIMAGTTIFETKEVAHAQYIAASLEGMKVGANDILFHELIDRVFKNKSYFNFGICNESDGRILNHGLCNWKEGFGGRTIVHNFYEIDTSNYKNLEQVIK